jgi:DNA-binding CsgD family transcriptional regulator
MPPDSHLIRRLDELRVAIRSPGSFQLDELAAELRPLLGAHRAAVFGFRGDADLIRLDLFHSAGMPGRTPRVLDGALAEDPSWAFHPLRPAPAQRNRSVAFRARSIEPMRARIPALDRVLESEPWISDEHQLRYLVCDGPDLLAWFGVFREGRSPFTEREAGILRRLAPALRERLRLERDLGRGRLALAVLPAALEEIPSAAFLVSPRGKVVHANRAGRAALETSGAAPGVRSALAAPGHPSFRWTEVRAPGLPVHFLAVARRPPTRHAERVAACARDLGLTPRQAEVLALLARGAANKTIAAELGCGEPTVEFHVTALLAKAGCESRSALVARFWSES